MHSDSLGGAADSRPGRRAFRAALVAVLACLFALLPAPAQAKSFSDVASGEWYTEYVAYVSDKGLMTGYTDGTNRFGPGDTVTRGMVATVLYRFATGDAGSGGASSTFKDVKSKQWYTTPIEWCYKKGIVTGDKNASGKLTGYFRPNDPVTREELAVMLYRFAKQYGHVSGSETWRYTFTDYNSISDWAREGVRWCQYNGILTGYVDGWSRSIQPHNNATRAEMAKMLTVFCRDVFGGTAKTYTYELYTVGQADLAPFTSVDNVLFVKTDATPTNLKLVDQTDSGASLFAVNSTNASDISISDTTSGVFRQVKGGWVVMCKFSKAGTHTLVLYDGTRRLATFTLKVQDYSAAEDAWIDAVIAKNTNSSMDSFAKMNAVVNWLYPTFRYLDNKLENGNNYLVYLARRSVPYFVSYQWDSYVSPAVLCKFANKIGGFDSVTNMYYSGDWSMHYYCKCVKGSTTKYFQACPISSTGLITSWDMIDFTKPASYLHYDPKALRHIPGTALSDVAGQSLDSDEVTFDEVDGQASVEGQASGVEASADVSATFDDVAGDGGETTAGKVGETTSDADADAADGGSADPTQVAGTDDSEAGQDGAAGGTAGEGVADTTQIADAADYGAGQDSADAAGFETGEGSTVAADATGAGGAGFEDVAAVVPSSQDAASGAADGTSDAAADGSASLDATFDAVELAEAPLAA